MFFYCAGLLILLPFCYNQELKCDPQKDRLCSGDMITSTCSIEDTVVIWFIQSGQGDFQIDFNTRNNIGDTESDGAFSANLTKHYPHPDTVSESILQFTLSEKLNGTKVTCLNLNNESLAESCVIANTGQLIITWPK